MFVAAFFLSRTCGYIFLNRRSLMTSATKMLLFGMRQTFHMQFGSRVVLGLLPWSIIHQRYCRTDYADPRPSFTNNRGLWFSTYPFACPLSLSDFLHDGHHVTCRLWSTMGACMLMFSLHAQDTLQILVILSMSQNLPLGGHIVRILCLHICDIDFCKLHGSEQNLLLFCYSFSCCDILAQVQSW